VLPFGLQAAVLLLLMLGIVCGLWRLGHPEAVAAFLGSAPLLGAASRLPYRWYPKPLRVALQIAYAGGVIAWCLRTASNSSADIISAELAAGLGVALIIRGTGRDLTLCSLLALLLTGYGGLSPDRAVYLPAATAFFLVGLFALYDTRLVRLAGRAAAAPGGAVRDFIRAPAGPDMLMHFVVFLLLWAGAVLIVPMPAPALSRGAVPVAFSAPTNPAWHTVWDRWFGRGRSGGSDGRGQEAERGAPGGRKSEGRRTITTWVGGRTVESRRITGVGATSDQIIFRVQCPGPLYWLVRLYDVFDGRKWSTSRALLRTFRGDATLVEFENVTFRVFQHFTIENPVSPRLPAAFRFERLVAWPRVGPKAETLDRREVRVGAAGPVLHAPLPPAPWRYTCTSRIVTGPETTDASLRWTDPNPALHYLVLPWSEPPPVLERLVKRLTANATDDLERATALRDYLRAHYSYTLRPPPTPPDADPVVYFLTVSRKGYCVHFAEALTVLARVAGLPARVAAGYAPGDYNVLTGEFEVRGYHAHAWSQIFVRRYGWLTFDAVPPSQLQFRITPSLLGKFHDPFGDDWLQRPPEVALAPRLQEASKELEDMSTRVDEDGAPAAFKMLADFFNSVDLERDRGVGPVQAYARAAGRTLREDGAAFLRNIGKDLARAVAAGWKGLRRNAIEAARRVWTLLRHSWAVAAAAAACFLLFCVFGRALHGTADRIRRALRCTWLRRKLQRREDQGEAVVFTAARFCMDVLTLHGVSRRVDADLLEFAAVVERRAPECGVPFRCVAETVFAALYGARPVGPEEVERARRAALDLWRRVRGHRRFGNRAGGRNREDEAS